MRSVPGFSAVARQWVGERTVISDFVFVLALGRFPFLLGDSVKLVAAALVAGGGRRVARRG